ncbi:DUF6801 domain-containing protein [Amycolatopsis sp., V23-08]|uniref:DUF6801 domain-containing protein n=1 Tax=Amycolatopsis heterodermiae TaxID=3110235 RepID=A0ABU5RCT2_9PSEU|nr:DUF6801 domain-containing protein [Amycolatopsis sp., V23-08]MEA5364057.1 DUF6801 domain-containing protein [Amycolatopsis sp., V23-08]
MPAARFLTPAAVAAAVLAATAGPAHASTAFASGALAYTCGFPGGSAQAVTVTESFTGPDTVAPGAAFSITNISGAITLSPAALAALTGAGYDGVQGGIAAAVVVPANATRPPDPAGAATVQAGTWGPAPQAITFHGGHQPFVAGASGVVTFGRTTSLFLQLTFHLAPGATGSTGFGMTCTQQAGQNAAFTPALPIQ